MKAKHLLSTCHCVRGKHGKPCSHFTAGLGVGESGKTLVHKGSTEMCYGEKLS